MDRPNIFSLLTLFLGLILGHWLRIGVESSKRRRDFVAFARTWQMEIFRLHLVGMKEVRKESAFTDHRSEFVSKARDIKRDLKRCRRKRFDGLVDSIEGFQIYRLGTQKGSDEVNLALENIIGIADVA